MTAPPRPADLRRPCGPLPPIPSVWGPQRSVLLAHASADALAAVLGGSSHLDHLVTESLAVPIRSVTQ